MSGRVLGPMAAVILCAVACGDGAGPTRTTGEVGDARPYPWPFAEDGSLRQVGKYEDELREHPELFPIAELPGGVMPARDIEPIGVARVDASQLERLLTRVGWAVVDVRKDEDVLASGVIPGSLHLEYRFEGYDGYGSTRLTREVAETLLDVHPGIVFLCNGEKCPRSFNACVHAVQRWSLEPSRVRWFHAGLPTWTLSPLIAPAGLPSKAAVPGPR